MKKLVLLLSLIAPLAQAAPLDAVPNVPIQYTDNLTRTQLPSVFTTDRGAFALYESLQQAGETYVQANGCKTVQGRVDAYVDQTGTGDLVLTTPGSTLRLDVTRTANNDFRGNKFQVLAKTGALAEQTLNDIIGNFTYNAAGTIMTGATDVSVPTSDPALPDLFSSVVIKDFYKEQLVIDEESRDFTLDWGLQVIHKKTFPVSKYWQRSYSVHDDGVEGRTKFVKNRIAGGTPCKIVVTTHGLDNSEIFWQQGLFFIKPL